MRTGRPSEYTEKKGAQICELLAGGMGLVRVCARPDMPKRDTVLRWIERFPEFRDSYARARAAQADFWAEQCLDIADDGTNDTYKLEDGSEKVAHDHIQRSRLRVDTRKWLLAKLQPQRYGEFQRTELTGADGGGIQIVVEIAERKPRGRDTD